MPRAAQASCPWPRGHVFRLLDDEEERRAMPIVRSVRRIVVSGGASGLLGGLLMALVLASRAVIAGAAPLAPFALFGSSLLATSSPGSHATSVVLGLVVHVTVSLFFGMAFSAIVGRRRGGLALGWLATGLAATFVVMLVMTFGVVPVVAPTLYDGIARDWPTWVVAHVGYGVGLAFEPLWRRSLVALHAPRPRDVASA